MRRIPRGWTVPAAGLVRSFRRVLRRRAYRQSLPVSLVRAHGRAPFPPCLRGKEVAGVDLVMLDADIAGHLSSWGDGSRRRQKDREVALTANLDDLDRVLPLLTLQEESDYVRSLRPLVLHVLRRADDANPPGGAGGAGGAES